MRSHALILFFLASFAGAVEVEYGCADQCVEPVAACEVVAYGIHAVCDLEERYDAYETQCTPDNTGQTFQQTIDYKRGQHCFLHTYQECADGTRTDVFIDEIGSTVPVLVPDAPASLVASIPTETTGGLIDSNSNIGAFNGSIATTIDIGSAGRDRLVVVHLALEFTGSTGDFPTSVDIGGTPIIGNVIGASTGAGFRVGFSYYAFESQLPATGGTYTVNATFSGASHSNKEVEAIAVEYHEGIDEAAGLVDSGTFHSSNRIGSGGVVLNPSGVDFLIVAGLASGGVDSVVWNNPANVVNTEHSSNAEGSISAASAYGSNSTQQTIGWIALNTIRFGMVAGLFATTN